MAKTFEDIVNERTGRIREKTKSFTDIISERGFQPYEEADTRGESLNNEQLSIPHMTGYDFVRQNIESLPQPTRTITPTNVTPTRSMLGSLNASTPIDGTVKESTTQQVVPDSGHIISYENYYNSLPWYRKMFADKPVAQKAIEDAADFERGRKAAEVSYNPLSANFSYPVISNIAKGAGDFIKSGLRGIVNTVARAPGAKMFRDTDTDLWEESAYDKGLKQREQELYKQKGTVGKFVYDVERGMGSSIPAIAVGGVPGLATMGALAGGQNAQQALDSGANATDAALHGVITGTAEAVTEKLFGYVPGLKMLEKELSGLTGSMGKNAGKIGLNLLKKSSGEGLEELIMDPVTGLSEKMTYNPNKSWAGNNGVFDAKQMAYDFLVGMGSGVLMGAPQVAGQTLDARDAQQTITQNIQRELTDALAMPKNTQSYQKALNILDTGINTTIEDFADFIHTKAKETQAIDSFENQASPAINRKPILMQPMAGGQQTFRFKDDVLAQQQRQNADPLTTNSMPKGESILPQQNNNLKTQNKADDFGIGINVATKTTNQNIGNGNVATQIKEEKAQGKESYKHFTTKEGKAALESGKPFDFNLKPIHGTGGLDNGEKIGRIASVPAIYLSLNDKVWGTNSTFVQKGEPRPYDITKDKGNKSLKPYYDYENQEWMVDEGEYKNEQLHPVTYNIKPEANIITIDSPEKLKQVSSKHWDSEEFWNDLKSRYDGVKILNANRYAGASKFFRSAKADQIVMFNQDAMEIEKSETKDVSSPQEQKANKEENNTISTKGRYEIGTKVKSPVGTTYEVIESKDGEYRIRSTDGKRTLPVTEEVLNKYKVVEESKDTQPNKTDTQTSQEEVAASNEPVDNQDGKSKNSSVENESISNKDIEANDNIKQEETKPESVEEEKPALEQKIDAIDEKLNKLVETISGNGDIIKPEGGANNEPVNEVRPNGEGTLEGTQAKDVPEDGAERNTSKGTVPSTRENKGRNEPVNRAGDESRPSVGSSEGEVPSTTKRGGRSRTLKEEVKEEVKKITPEPKGSNFVIDGEIELGGDKQRFKDNVEAIKLAKQLETESRPATLEEQKLLSKYVGWGGLANAFDGYRFEWKNEYEELKQVLTPEEYASAKDSVSNAHYTSISVIKAMYDGLEKMGFKGGRMLEPSGGIGHFIGAMPTELSKLVSSWTMVELDSITGLIGKHLYPQANVKIQGFEKANIADNFMDVAIGNVPFGNFPVVDSRYPKSVTSSIHNYFFAKAIDKVRPGGLVMFITSRYTMDSKSSAVREYIAKKADLIGAIRLPNTAFKSNAKTEVVTDIIILKKRAENTPYGGESFLSSNEFRLPNDYRTADVNEYFSKHPEMILGKPDFKSGMYGGRDITYNPLEGNLSDHIANAFKKIKGKMDYPVKTEKEVVDEIKKEIVPAPNHVKNGAYAIQNGSFYVRDGENLVPYTPKNAKEGARIKGLIEIRDSVRELMRLQLDNSSDSDIAKSRTKLNKLYDKFVNEYGSIHSRGNSMAFGDDPDYYLLLSLENYNEANQTATKADIFTKDTLKPAKKVDSVNNSKDALIVSLNEFGNINFSRMMALTVKSKKEITDELKTDNLIFKQTDGSYEIAERYLSGNVRAKLREAEAMAETDPEYKANIEALKAVQPTEIDHKDIGVSIGATWIPESVYAEFASHLFNRPAGDFKVTYLKSTGSWVLEAKGYGIGNSVEATTTWGTNKKDGWKILSAIFNKSDIKVTVTDSEGKVTVLKDDTIAAKEKEEAIKNEFEKWIWQDESRIKALSELYNAEFNNIALPQYNGAHLKIMGMNPSKQLREHQLNAVWRVVSSGGNTLLAHKVGAGKSGEMAGAAMVLRQMGIVKKPMFVVPNHLVEQWGKEFLSFFPSANVLVATKKDFEKSKRKVLMNRIATGDYDAVIIGESSFKFLPMSEESTKGFYQEQLDQLEEGLRELSAQGLRKNDPTVKQLVAAQKKLRAKMESKSEAIKKDSDNISFEQLGVDSLFVDEAHRFKNLFYQTNMTNVSGLGNKDGSDRAFDLYMKVRYLQKLNGGKGIVFATATPVMNSMSEMYIMQKYLQTDLLEQRGLMSFDAWANAFGKIVTVMEMTPEGKGYRQKQSFSRFKNLGELVQMFRSMADVLTDIPGLKIPALKDGKRTTVVSEPSEFQLDYINELANRAELVRKKEVDPRDDNMLKITGEGRKLALDPRLIDPTAPDDPNSKTNKAVDNVFKVWSDTKKDRLTQLIFADLSTPKGESKSTKDDEQQAQQTEESNDNVSVYDDIKRKLLLKGIPAKEIAFIHDAKTDAQKLALYNQVNSGEVRILMGSTEKMGVGMNVQKKLIALHHLDAPWRPGDIEQREGRILRQGNENSEVEIFTYVTEKTFDARMWDNLQRKATFISQIMTSGTDAREAEDIGEFALSAAEIKAIASGNPMILEQFENEAQVSKLNALKKSYESEKFIQQQKLAQAKSGLIYSKERLAEVEEDIKIHQDTSGDKFKMVIGKKTYAKREDAGDAIHKIFRDTVLTNDKSIGSFAGFELLLTPMGELKLKGSGVYTSKLNPDSPAGSIQSLENSVRRLDEKVETYKNRIKEHEANIPKIEESLKRPFEHEEKLEELLKRRKEIMDTLNASEDETSGNAESDSEDSEFDSFASANSGPGIGKATGLNTSKKSKRASEIFKDFGNKLDASIKQGKSERGTLGTFNRMNHIIKIKKANDIPVLSHETGHMLDEMYQFNKMRPYFAELENLGQATSRKSYSKDRIRREGVAEFVRLFLTDENAAMSKAPSFYTYFIQKVNGDTLKVLHDLRKDIWDLTNLDPVNRVSKSVHFMGDKEQGQSFDPMSMLRVAYTGIVEQQYPLEWAAKKAEGKAGKEKIHNKLAAFRGYEDMAMHDLNPTGNKDFFQSNLDKKKVGESYYTISESVHKDEETRRDFWTYAVARRALDYFDKGLDMPDTLETYEETIRIQELKYPEFKKVFDDIKDFQANSYHLLVEGEIYTQEKFDEVQAANPNYVSLQRIMDAFDGVAGSTGKLGGAKKLVKRAVGSGRDILDPEESLINNTFLYRSAAMRNKILLDFVDMFDHSVNKNAPKGLGHLVSRSQVDMKKIQFNMQKIEKELKDMGVDTTGMNLDVLARIYSPNYLAGSNQVVVYRKGEPILYDVHPELYEAMVGMKYDSMNLITNMLASVAHLQKAGIILTEKYLAYNFTRDAAGGLITSNAGIKPWDIALGIVDAIFKGKGYRMAMLHGGGTNYFSANDRKFAQEVTKDYLAGKGFYNSIMNKIKHPLRTLELLTKPFEMGARIAELKKYLNKFGYSDENIEKAIAASRDLSIDFRRMGGWIKKFHLNRMSNFLNSQIQGMDKTVRLFADKRTRSRTIIRGLLWFTLPTLFLYWYNKDNEEYNNLPKWRKDFFWNIPIGDPKSTNVFLPIPRPWELGLIFCTLPERIMDWKVKENPHAWKEFGKSLEQTFLPEFQVSAFMPEWEVLTNRDWRDRPIKSNSDERVSPKMQYNDYTSEISKKIAQATSGIPGMPEMLQSPKKIDHLVQGHLGTWGRTLLDAADVAAGKKDFFEGYSNKFLANSQQSSESVNQYYEDRQDVINKYYDAQRAGSKPSPIDKAMFSEYNKIDKLMSKLREAQDILEHSEDPNKKLRIAALQRAMSKLSARMNILHDKVYK